MKVVKLTKKCLFLCFAHRNGLVLLGKKKQPVPMKWNYLTRSCLDNKVKEY